MSDVTRTPPQWVELRQTWVVPGVVVVVVVVVFCSPSLFANGKVSIRENAGKRKVGRRFRLVPRRLAGRTLGPIKLDTRAPGWSRLAFCYRVLPSFSFFFRQPIDRSHNEAKGFPLGGFYEVEELFFFNSLSLSLSFLKGEKKNISIQLGAIFIGIHERPIGLMRP